mmetsp:Transcript_11562/g.24524  ORF Transcript_11562/g.24524 Transcript_11562/m.24524 type:complete len:96 (+) Transcript_11562:201-488(+)
MDQSVGRIETEFVFRPATIQELAECSVHAIHRCCDGILPEVWNGEKKWPCAGAATQDAGLLLLLCVCACARVYGTSGTPPPPPTKHYSRSAFRFW